MSCTLTVVGKLYTNNTVIVLYSSVKAGFPSPADDFLEQSLSLDELVIQNPSTTFFAKITGDSMTDAGIFPDSIIVIDRSLTAQSGDIIVAVLNGGFTVKRMIKRKNKCILKAENTLYEDIDIDEYSDFKIWGVVIRSFHKP
jgi:DNA polymerase V